MDISCGPIKSTVDDWRNHNDHGGIWPVTGQIPGDLRKSFFAIIVYSGGKPVILLVETVLILLLVGLMVQTIFPVVRDYGLITCGLVYLTALYMITIGIGMVIPIDHDTLLYGCIIVSLVLFLGLAIYHHAGFSTFIKPMVKPLMISIGFIVCSIGFYFALTYMHPETMVSLGSQWNTSSILASLLNAFSSSQSTLPSSEMLQPFYGPFVFLISHFQGLPANPLPTVLQLFSVVYFTVFLETTYSLGMRFKLKIAAIFGLFALSICVFNNVFDLYFAVIADVWLWLVFALMPYEDLKNSFCTNLWCIVVILFGFSFGNIGAVLASLDAVGYLCSRVSLDYQRQSVATYFLLIVLILNLKKNIKHL